MVELDGRTVVITGAGRGLGAALATSLAETGCKIILCGRSLVALEKVADGIAEATGRRPVCIAVDLAESASVRGAVEAIVDAHEHIDLLINNGAMWLEARDEPYPAEEVLGVINSAVTGTFLFSQGLLPLLRRSANPDIVTIGSVSGLPNGLLDGVSVPFYAAKRGQAAIAEGLRQMLAGTPVRSIILHPPDLDDIQPGELAWGEAPGRAKSARATNRDVVEAVLFAVTRPRNISLSIVLDADDGGVFPAQVS
ncbi:SDR family oxidoreductase [Shinella curvata]|uniref:SDR family oxidoreductase n=1 Tax=Shinella curvata TaxID=1817964 RepID=A0ABT8XFM7_9HYPH|nr:SDR family oxidoreductase [Shinella curvata]MCJ8053122.1 SDR family oxidoreductase [Shinella curvata]MDO6122453.1 SDR family oxidoreductase [Shinella curvata]